MKWSMWFGLFEGTVHNQPISDAEKITHLLTLTTGKENQAISGYFCNSTMYNAALHELRRRYGRPDIIINNFVNRLQSFKQPSTHRTDSYIEFSTFISNMVETFRTLGFKDSSIYVPLAVSKLQHHQQLQWSQYITAQKLDQPYLIAFNDWIRQFALACDHLPHIQPQQITLDSNDRQQITPRLRHANGSDHQPTSLHRRLLKIGVQIPDLHVPSTDKLTTQHTVASIKIHLWRRRRDSFLKRNFVSTALANIK